MSSSIQKPSSFINWMPGGTTPDVVVPDNTKQSIGWGVEKPAREYFNGIMQNYGYWFDFLNNAMYGADSTNRIGLGKLVLNGAAGQHLSAIGYQAGAGSHGNSCFFAGPSAGLNTRGDFIVGLGDQAAAFGGNDYGWHVVAIGYNAVQYNFGSEVIGIGKEASHTNNGYYIIGIGSEAMKFNSGSNNIGIGDFAGGAPNNTTDLTSGNYNTSVGSQAGFSMGSSSWCTSLGAYASYHTRGNYRVSIGYYAGNYDGATGVNNTVNIGYYAGQNSQASGIVSIGYQAGKSTPSSLTNGVCIGNGAGSQNNIADANAYGADWICIGTSSGARDTLSSSSTGDHQIFIGNSAGKRRNTGAHGIGIGYQALLDSVADTVIAIGKNAGAKLNGSDIIAIGENAGSNTTTLVRDRSIFIGVSAGRDATAGDHIIALGDSCGQGASGGFNIFIGASNAGKFNSGWNSVHIGQTSGYNSSGSNCVGIGMATLVSNGDIGTAGLGLVAVGSEALNQASTSGSRYTNYGNYITAIGYRAGFSNSGINTIGQGSIFIGAFQGQNFSETSAYLNKRLQIGCDLDSHIIEGYMRTVADTVDYQLLRVNATMTLSQLVTDGQKTNLEAGYTTAQANGALVNIYLLSNGSSKTWERHGLFKRNSLDYYMPITADTPNVATSEMADYLSKLNNYQKPGTIIFNTTLNKLQMYNGTTWETITSV